VERESEVLYPRGIYDLGMKLPVLQNTKELAVLGVSAGEDFAPEVGNRRGLTQCLKDAKRI
jgi:hypothetical protein